MMLNAGQATLRHHDVLRDLQGRTVSRCSVDAGFCLEFLEDSEATTIRIEGAFRVRSDEQEREFSPARHVDLGPALDLIGKTVAEATVGHDGSLDVRFADGTRLMVAADARFEAWELTAPGGRLIVSLPGGGAATWGAETPEDANGGLTVSTSPRRRDP
ncbi:MAG: DUF6188 family protein [Chloroflexota bacterium]